MAATDEQLMTPDEAAAFLKVKRSTIYAWVCQGFIPHVKLGGRLRFRRPALEAWLQAQEITGRTTRIPEFDLKEARRSRKFPPPG